MRRRNEALLTMGVAAMLLGCSPAPAPAPANRAPRDDAAHAAGEPHLIRYACEGFDAAVEADAPHDRLLSHTAKHATELGGEAVERATQRWALTPPQGLLEELERYEASGADPSTCAGLRAHLERLAMRAATH